MEKYPEKNLFWGFAPLPAYSGKKGRFGGSHLYPRIAGKRGVLGVRTFTPLAGKKGFIRSPHTSSKYPIDPSGPVVAPVQQPDSYYPVTSCA